ncbi:MAG: putative peptidyl-prolyl cis-trans isomerase [Bacteroidetes bacterium ADurb.Bin041]|nr:MAG: putative peptidyl-prolyl cis-trans isomerase [Bacteroidetes bacterium ADurb.Bin041]
MKKFVTYFFIYLSSLLLFSCSTKRESSSKENLEETLILIETSYGNIKIKLYNEAPIHRENFIKLANSGIYNGTIFHRVINNFMIQGGDPATKPQFDSKNDSILLNYTLQAEFRPNLFHKKGALAAARMGDNVNPEKNSSGTQFYIVQGKIFTNEELSVLAKRKNDNLKNQILYSLIIEKSDGLTAKGIEPNYSELAKSLQDTLDFILSNKPNYNFSDDQIAAYTTIGGTPHLDGDYTVFGEVVEGLDVIDKIAAVKTGAFDRPVEDIPMKVTIVTK